MPPQTVEVKKSRIFHSEGIAFLRSGRKLSNASPMGTQSVLFFIAEIIGARRRRVVDLLMEATFRRLLDTKYVPRDTRTVTMVNAIRLYE